MLNKSLCGELVARCFQARNDAHIAHLVTNKYSKHIALDEFYHGIITEADAFAESAQGRANALLAYPVLPHSSEASTPEEVVEGLRNWIDANRRQCTDYSELQNQIDNIVAECNSILYKLRRLA